MASLPVSLRSEYVGGHFTIGWQEAAGENVAHLVEHHRFLIKPQVTPIGLAAQYGGDDLGLGLHGHCFF